jgi:hypothetical protein
MMAGGAGFRAAAGAEIASKAVTNNTKSRQVGEAASATT